MKKLLALLVALAIILPTAVGCGTTKAAIKTGLAVIISVSSSKDAGDADGQVQVNSTVIGLTVAANGKIERCTIDMVQTKINFSKEGKLTTALDTKVQTKQELGAAYGMGKASSIKKEWNEQANAFAAYVVGKTVSEVKGIAVSSEGVPTGTDLKSSVTIHVTDFIKGIEKAAASAKDSGAKAGDTLGLGISTTINKSKDAGDADGVGQAYSYYTATTYDATGKITSCIIDASVTDVKFDKTGKITTDLKVAPQTKNELGTAYGMGKVSTIKKEWNEQAASFAAYVLGKTVDQVKGIAMTADGKATIAELTSSVTIHVSDFIKIIEKSKANAK